MKKSQQTTDNGQQTTTIHASYEAARGVMMRLGVGEIWHTSDGQWFTAADKAEDHAEKMTSTGSGSENGNGSVTGKIQYFKLKKF
ncbi:MAG: hypothetical protein IKC86_07360 [Prevotella sp.]|nr:hypothetical protein [Prevotella sp.]